MTPLELLKLNATESAPDGSCLEYYFNDDGYEDCGIFFRSERHVNAENKNKVVVAQYLADVFEVDDNFNLIYICKYGVEGTEKAYESFKLKAETTLFRWRMEYELKNENKINKKVKL